MNADLCHQGPGKKTAAMLISTQTKKQAKGNVCRRARRVVREVFAKPEPSAGKQILVCAFKQICFLKLKCI